MTAYVFPGQGAQYTGMGLPLYKGNPIAKRMFEQANDILGFNIADIMFYGSADDLKQTKVTQPAIYLHSVILVACMGQQFQPHMVAGHSLGEFSALTANQCISFEDGLRLVAQRAQAMQLACEDKATGMAAVINTDSRIIADVCNSISPEIVVPANYNYPGQTVISGSLAGIAQATEQLMAMGTKKIIPLKVSGAFHSPYMKQAQASLAAAIEHTTFRQPCCPVYQNCTARPSVDTEEIKANLIAQLTSPVQWTQSVQNMIHNGARNFVEIGPGEVLKGLIKRIDPSIDISNISE